MRKKLQIDRKITQICHSQWMSKCKKLFSFRGLCPLTPQRGLCPLDPRWGLRPQTPVIGSRSRARHAAPHPTSPSLLSASDTTLLSGYRACSRYRVKIGVVQSWKSEWFRLESLDPVSLLIYIIIIPCIPGNVCPRLSPTALLPLFLAVHGKRQHGIWISLKIWMLLFLRQTKKRKNDDENESYEPQSFVTQTIPNKSKYLMAKSMAEIFKSIQNSQRCKIASATILNNNYVAAHTQAKYA